MVHPSQSDGVSQFRLIGEFVDWLNGAEMTFWLSGGWAVDFHVGRVTRPHSDIDFIVNLDDRTRLRRLLEQKGFVTTWVDKGGGVEWFESDGIRIEVSYITKNNDGSMVTPGYESWPWPDDSFPDEYVTLAGITVRAVSVAGLLDMKSGWEKNLDEKPRPHDLADIELLETLLGNR